MAFADDALTDGVLLVDPYAGKVNFDIKATGEWRIEENVRFFYLSPSSGTGPATVTLTVQVAEGTDTVLKTKLFG